MRKFPYWQAASSIINLVVWVQKIFGINQECYHSENVIERQEIIKTIRAAKCRFLFHDKWKNIAYYTKTEKKRMEQGLISSHW